MAMSTHLVTGDSSVPRCDARCAAPLGFVTMPAIGSGGRLKPLRPLSDQVDSPDQHERTDQQHYRQRDGPRVVVLFEAHHDEIRRNLRLEWEVAGNEDDRDVFAYRPGHR